MYVCQKSDTVETGNWVGYLALDVGLGNKKRRPHYGNLTVRKGAINV